MRLTRRTRTLLASTLLAVTAGCTVGSFLAGTASANAPAQAKAQCRINFQASSLNLHIGQDLVLTWVAVGADKLTASWTSGYVPFAGSVTTTMKKSGKYSYQVTGTNGGSYCGGAGVEVAFTGGTPSQAATSTAPNGGGNTPSSTANGGSNNGGTTTGTSTGGNNGGTGGGNGGGNTGNGTASHGVGGVVANPGTKYPRQSPTSGSGVAWYQQPMNLLAIGALALLCALALLKREPLRATIVHRH